MILKRKRAKRSPGDQTGREARMTCDIEALIRNLAGRGEGRLVLRSGGFSLIKRTPMDFWPGSVAGCMRLPGFELMTGDLIAVCSRWPEEPSLAVSVFDRDWRLQFVLLVPGLQWPRCLEGAGSIRLDDGRIQEGSGAGHLVCWDDLWPEGEGLEDGSLEVATLAGQVLTVEMQRESFSFSTEFKVSVLDFDGPFVRMSDLPRTQVCYADSRLVIQANGGLWLKLVA
ncbi:MAG: hypothetical protein AAGI48_03515 [Verrucomicrobiota bacterium]